MKIMKPRFVGREIHEGKSNFIDIEMSGNEMFWPRLTTKYGNFVLGMVKQGWIWTMTRKIGVFELYFPLHLHLHCFVIFSEHIISDSVHKMRLDTNVRKLLTHVIWFFGKHATIKVPTVAKEMVGWWLVVYSRKPLTGNKTQPSTENSHVVVCWAHVLEPRSMIKDFLYSAPIPSLCWDQWFFQFFHGSYASGCTGWSNHIQYLRQCWALIPHPVKTFVLQVLKWCLTASTGFKKKIHILYFHPSHVIESMPGQCMSL